MNSAEYDFLRTNPRFGKRIILMGLGGSYAYGTNNENSDIDFRGITLNLPSDYQYLQDERVKYKKYIYALRPLLACRYIEQNHAVPPVKFEDLIVQTLPGDLSEEIERMLAVKADSDEKDLNPRMPVIQRFLEEEIARYEQLSKEMPDDRKRDWEELDRAFLKVLG